ncbi:MAG: DUF2797 domain-containing protein [Candidatus Lokiarchaeota archaeon]|nr:DUF2797 domain-containing protein [Candidatus Lokiarchaeota archaeon]
MQITSKDVQEVENATRELSRVDEFSLYPTFYIRYYTYRPVSDLLMPHLDIISDHDDTQIVPFYGHVMFKLSEGHYCETCFQPLEEPTNHCLDCLKKSGIDFLYCVKKGPGFGTGNCSPEHPCCESEFSQNYCKREHALYLATFGQNHIKVGISRLDRVIYRLLEQGASHAITFRRSNNLNNFIYIHELEQKIKEECGILDSLSFDEKAPLFENQKHDFESDILKMNIYSDLFKHLYELIPQYQLNLSNFYTHFPRIDKYCKYIKKLNGNIKYFRGNVAVLEQDGERVAFDLNKLSGKKILNVIG